MRFMITCPFGAVIVTCSSRGIESIEIVGLLGSIRTSSISLECGTTKPPGLSLGGGRRSSPTSSSVSGAPCAGGGQDLRRELDRLVLAERFDHFADLVESHDGGRRAREQHDPEAAEQEALCHPPPRRGGSGGNPGATPLSTGRVVLTAHSAVAVQMRMRGLEPPPGCPDTDLNRARLPIPPHPRDDGQRRYRTGGGRAAVHWSRFAPQPSRPVGRTRARGALLASTQPIARRYRPGD